MAVNPMIGHVGLRSNGGFFTNNLAAEFTIQGRIVPVPVGIGAAGAIG
jgi:hypothetical protein